MAKMVKIKRIGVLSLGRVFGIFYGVMGFIFGAIMTLMSLFSIFLGNQGIGILFFGIGAIIFLPILYGVMAFVVGLIMAFLYNLVASRLGGVEVEAE